MAPLVAGRRTPLAPDACHNPKPLDKSSFTPYDLSLHTILYNPSELGHTRACGGRSYYCFPALSSTAGSLSGFFRGRHPGIPAVLHAAPSAQPRVPSRKCLLSLVLVVAAFSGRFQESVYWHTGALISRTMHATCKAESIIADAACLSGG